jgi:ADP-dependent phosphofructokinase/glucokinase
MPHDVVLGMGGCLDYEIAWDSTVLERLAAEYAVDPDELSTAVPVLSERDLVRSVLAFVRDGVGGERFVASSDIVETFAARFARSITLGGTCVRAALAMSRLGVRSTVHLVSIDDHVRRLLPEQVSYVCSATEDSTDPHLIVQFPAGARVRVGDVELVAPHSNRLIYVNDRPNRELRLSPELGPALRDAAVFLISGFNSMQDTDMVDQRLRELRDQMRCLPPGALVVYEDAGFHVPDLSRRVRDALLDRVDVYGMNEDEMQGYLGRPLDLLDAEAMPVALRELHDVVPAATLVVHTRAWVLAYGPGAETYRAALRTATCAAGARYLHGDEFTEADCRAVGDGPEHPEGAAFARRIELLLPGVVCCVPAYRLSSASPTTIGLGDCFVGGLIAALAPAS